MTLKDYYEKLERETPPKTSFVREIAEQCGVNEATVRNWIKYGMKPNETKHIQILSLKTGIPIEELWK